MLDYDREAPDLQNIATGLHRIANAIIALGNGNAATQMGAIEHLAVTIKESIENFSLQMSESNCVNVSLDPDVDGLLTSIARSVSTIADK